MDLAAAARVAMCDALAGLLNSGKLKIYTGTAPDADAAATGTLLGTLTLNATAFGAASDNGTRALATANAITPDSAADATGTAGYFRVTKSDDTLVYQGDVTATGGGGDLELDSVSISAGVQIDVTSLTIQVDEVR